MDHPPILAEVRKAMSLPDFDAELAWSHMIPRHRSGIRLRPREGSGRPASVLILLYPLWDDLAFVLTRRTDKVGSHKGQISLPGGRHEPDDTSDEATALREACEEIGFCDSCSLEMLGRLTPVWVTVSNFVVHPIVGAARIRPQFSPDPTEVAELIDMPLSALLDDRHKAITPINVQGFELEAPCYRLGDHIIWGATAIILSELEHRLRAVRAQGNGYAGF